MGTGLEHAFIVHTNELLRAIIAYYCVIYFVNYIFGKWYIGNFEH